MNKPKIINPSGNKLPSGLTLDKLQSAIDESGYPLQQVAGHILKENGYHLNHEWAFKDRIENKLRTADLLASKSLWDRQEKQPRVRPEVNILIECKHSSDAYIFFETDQSVYSPLFPMICGLKNQIITVSTDDSLSKWLYDLPSALGLREHAFINGAHGPTVINVAKSSFNGGGKVTLSGDDPYRSLVLPLVSALLAYSEVEKPNKTQRYFDAHLTLALAVVDAPMLTAQIGKKKSVLSKTPWVRVIRHEPKDNSHSYEHHGRFIGIDVVHKSFLDSYLKDHLEDFISEYRNATFAHQEELFSGKGFARGLGKNSWANLKSRLVARSNAPD